VFSADGRSYGLSVRDVPEAGLTSRGKALAQLLEMGKKAEVAGVQVVAEFRADRSVLFATADGTVKRTSLDQYANARAAGIEAIKLTGKDTVVDVRVTDGEGEVIVAASGGRAIRFPEAEVPLMGRVAQGVRGIKLKEGERVVGLAVARREGGELCLVTERGWAKRVPLEELQPQGRGGLGTALLVPAKETGAVAAAREVHPGEDLMAVTGGGRTVRIKLDTVPKSGRAGAPEKSVAITGNERVAEVTHVAERELPESPDDDTAPPADASVGGNAADAGPEETAAGGESASAAPGPEPTSEPSVNGRSAADEATPGAADELDLFG
jgi:DNA gyrase subunit A